MSHITRGPDARKSEGPGVGCRNCVTNYCINVSLLQSCSVSINNCRSESVQLLQEATLKSSDKQSNSCTGCASARIKHQLK
jgi:hypothetical protein